MLSLSTLKTNLYKVFDPASAGFVGYPTTTALGTANFADAYAAYAQDAVDFLPPLGDPLTLANVAGFKTKLAELSASVDLTTALTILDAAFVIYWTLATFAVLIPATGFSAETTSIVTLAPPAIISASLGAILSTNATSANLTTRIDDIATALHTYTTVNLVVTITGVSVPPPVPLILPSKVF